MRIKTLILNKLKKQNTLLAVVAFVLPLLFASCIKELEKEGIYTTTQCIGQLTEQRTNQPVVGMKVMVTNGEQTPRIVHSLSDGSFEISITAEELSKGYYLLFDADSLYEKKQLYLDGMGYGKKTYDVGVVYIVGPEVPVVQTLAVTNIAAASAQGGGIVTDGGKSTVSARGLCWSTDQYPTLSNAHSVSGDGLGAFESMMTGLSVSTTYYVRAYATNGVGTGYGDPYAFTTLPGLPEVNTAAVSEVTAHSALCGGEVLADGGFAVMARGVCWSTTAQPTIANSHSNSGSGIGNFVCTMNGLEVGTTYYVRAYATNSVGTVYGEQRVFTTQQGLPEVTTSEISEVGNGMAVCGGTVSADGGFTVLARGVCYGTSPDPTVTSAHTTDGSGTGNFVSQLINLSAGATYYVRAYATNGAGTAYGVQRVFVAE